jgi:hypothetical protein
MTQLYGCFVDEEQGSACVFDGEDNGCGGTYELSDCEIAMELYHCNKGKKECRYWKPIEQPTGVLDVKDIMDLLTVAIKDDPDYAWGWQCNIAMASFDEGLNKPAANRAAARFMRNCFGVDMTKHEHFEETQEGA